MQYLFIILFNSFEVQDQKNLSSLRLHLLFSHDYTYGCMLRKIQSGDHCGLNGSGVYIWLIT